MRNNRLFTLIAVFVTTLMLGTVAAPIALALDTPLYQESSSSSSGNGGDDSLANTGGVEITGYYLQSGGVVPDSITEGMGIGLELKITDMREEVIDYYKNIYNKTNNKTLKEIQVAGRLNTQSFDFQNQNSFHQTSKIRRVQINNRHGIQYSLYYELIYTGSGNSFQTDLYYTDVNTGATLDVPVHSLSLTLNQCKDAGESKEAVVKGTGFVLKSANYGGGSVTAGTEFMLTAEVLATSGNTNVENVTVTISPPEEITLSEGSSIAYVGTVAPNQTVPVSFKLFPNANIADGSYSIAVDIRGVDSNSGEDVSSQMTFSVPVVQPERFEIFETQLPTYMTIGMDDGSGMASVTLVNQGKGTVNNVSVEIVSKGITAEEGRQYLGHIAGGEERTADFMLLAEESGEVEAQVVVSYENARGDGKTLEHKFSVQVEESGEIPAPGPGEIDNIPEETTGLNVWGWMLIIVAIIVGVVIVIMIVRRRRKARIAAIEDEDLEDEDEDI